MPSVAISQSRGFSPSSAFMRTSSRPGPQKISSRPAFPTERRSWGSVTAAPAPLAPPRLPAGAPILGVDHVVAGPAVEPILALAAVYLVVPPKPPHHVVAAPSPELVPAGGSGERLPASRRLRRRR